MASRPPRPHVQQPLRERDDERAGTTLHRRVFGKALAQARDSMDWTGTEAVAQGVTNSATTLSRLETGNVKAKITHEVVESLVKVYEVSELTALKWREMASRIMAETAGAREEPVIVRDEFAPSDAFEEVQLLEQDASQIIQYAGTFVPGRVQTRQYSKVVMERAYAGRPDLLALIPDRLRRRRERQELLEWGASLHYSMIIAEHVLARPIPGEMAMLEQLLELQKLAKVREWMALRVLPHSAWQYEIPMAEAMTLLRFPAQEGPQGGEALPTVLYLEGSSPEVSRLYADQAMVDRYDANLISLSNVALGPEESLGFLQDRISWFEMILRGGFRAGRTATEGEVEPSRYAGHSPVLDPAAGGTLGRGLRMSPVPAGHVAGSVLADHGKPGEEAVDITAPADVAPVPSQRLP